jgi:hypothetical protein
MKRFALALPVLLAACLLGNMESTAQQQGGEVYWMSVSTVPLGKMQDYLAFVQKDLKPAQEKAGYHFVSGWLTIVGDIEEVVVVAKFGNMDAYQKSRAALTASPEWKVVGTKMEGLTRGVHTRLMVSLPDMTTK